MICTNKHKALVGSCGIASEHEPLSTHSTPTKAVETLSHHPELHPALHPAEQFLEDQTGIGKRSKSKTYLHARSSHILRSNDDDLMQALINAKKLYIRRPWPSRRLRHCGVEHSFLSTQRLCGEARVPPLWPQLLLSGFSKLPSGSWGGRVGLME